MLRMLKHLPIYGLSLLLALSGCAIVALSAWMNFEFWSTQASGWQALFILGGLAIASDVAKAILPIGIDKALGARWPGLTAACSLMLAVCIVASMCATIGFVSGNRAAVTGGAESLATQLDMARSKLASIASKLDQIPPARAVSVIESKIQTIKQHDRWRSSAGCTNDTAAASKALCTEYRTAKVELASALQRKSLMSDKAATDGRIKALIEAGAGRDINPQATTIAKIVQLLNPKMNEGLASLLLLGFVVVLIESASVLLPYAAFKLPGAAKRAEEIQEHKRAERERRAQHKASNDASMLAQHAEPVTVSRLPPPKQAPAKVLELTSYRVTEADFEDLDKALANEFSSAGVSR